MMFHLNHYPTGTEADADADAVGTGDSSTPSRPLKLPRRDSSGFGGAGISEQREPPLGSPSIVRETKPSGAEVQAQMAAARTRGVTACERCRLRKTRCDNRRPTCGYCAKLGVTCLYESESLYSCHVVGPQVLDALSNLTALIQRQKAGKRCCGQCHQQVQGVFSPDTVTSAESAQSPLAQIVLRRSQNAQQSRADTGIYSSHGNNSSEPRTVKRQRPIQAQGIETILDWKVYSLKVNFPNLFGEAKRNLIVTHQFPSLEYWELGRLESKYIAGVHIYNPILDLPTLHQSILHVSENGLDWSTGTCLVTLVCAIGAITGRYKEGFEPTSKSPASLSISLNTVMENGESEVDLAMRYWNVAVKRLGYAIGQDDIEAVQCLCLAGIWHMHILQPLQAWKYFSLAGNAWCAATLKGLNSPTRGTIDNQAKSLSLEQSLYFTIYKSEWSVHLVLKVLSLQSLRLDLYNYFSSCSELRVELDLPGSALEDIEFSQTFPLPPTLDGELTDNDSDVTERVWYYYLAEIAARHLINRMLRGRSWTHAEPSSEEIWRMLAEVEVFEAQVHDWHSSLPPLLRFNIPEGPFLAPESDELRLILRHRYMTNRELIYRPFVRLCVEHELDSLKPHLRAAVATLASHGLQYCVYKLSQLSPQRHQGTWFMIRGYATHSMILLAASKARRVPGFLGAASIIMPQNWKEQISQTMQEIGPCWEDGSGGVGEIRRVVEWALAAET